NSFSTITPTIRITRPTRFRAMISRPRRDPGSQRRRPSRWAAPTLALPNQRRSGFSVAVADAIEGFDRIELRIDLPELLAHALHMAVDGPVVDIDLILVGRVHE